MFSASLYIRWTLEETQERNFRRGSGKREDIYDMSMGRKQYIETQMK